MLPEEAMVGGPMCNSEELLFEAKRQFDPSYYISRYLDVSKAGIEPFSHYIKAGWREKRWPAPWFDPEKYIANHPEMDPATTNPLLHFVEYTAHPSYDMESQLQRIERNRMLFFSKTQGPFNSAADHDVPVVVSAKLPEKEDIEAVKPFFDEEYYLANNPDIAERGIRPLLHYMMIGWIEGRDPSARFSTYFYLQNNSDIRQSLINPFLHYVKFGSRERWRKTATVAEAKIIRRFNNDPELLGLVEEAKAIEPMVALPHSPRAVSIPLINHGRLTDAVESIRNEVGRSQYRYIVAVPHVRMSGAARVASVLCKALAQIREPKEILLVFTDGSQMEYAQWFPKEIRKFNLHKHIDGLTEEERVKCLIDLMRGVRASAVFNVNSRLFWDAIGLYGRQIPQEFRVVTYLFTWDETEKGDRVGYPIQWMRDTSGSHHLVLTDTENLANDVSERFGFGSLGHDDIVAPLYTPAQDQGITANIGIDGDAPRVLWAGRFDRQKRVDILVDIARQNPEFIFDVYGKPVLDGKGLEQYDPPENINYLGTYDSLSEVLETKYIAFLYTSQWDGLPTILLDMAMAGIPIVAPDVGGIRELVTADNGWLVNDFKDVKGFSKALKEIESDPDMAMLRAEIMSELVRQKFTEDAYVNQLDGLLKKNEI